MDTPKISIITINFNNKEGLERTILSVISQNFKDFEYIVIDGGSKDGSKEIIEKYNDQISYWVSEPDKGIYNAMNKGIAAAKGEYLLFLNSGDHFCEENSLETGVSYLGKEEIIYFNLKHIDNARTWVHEYPEYVNIFYFFENSLPHPGTFIKKNSFEKYGMYDENLKIVSDWKWFLVSICKNNATYRHINEVFTTFYYDGISSNVDNREKIKEESIKVYQSEFPIDLPYIEEIRSLQRENNYLKGFEYKYNHLRKYRIIKFLDKLGIITLK